MTVANQHNNDIASTIHTYLTQRFPAAGPITDDSQLLESGIVDSLGFVELMTFLSERFGIMLDDTHFEPDNLETPAALVRFVETYAA